MREVTALLNATSTAISASTTKTQLNGGSNLTVPAWARSIVSVTPYTTLVTMTAQQTYFPKFTLESDDVTVDPYVVLCTPQLGGLGTTHDVHCATPYTYPCNIPLAGGEELKLYGTPLVTNTVAPEMGCTVKVSNRPASMLGRQRFAQTGTITAITVTADAEKAGTAYTIHGAERLIGVYGVAGFNTTWDASKPAVGYFRLSSSDFKVAAPLKYCHTPAPAGLGTIGTPSMDQLIIHRVSIPTNQSCTIADYYTVEYTMSTAGRFCSAVFFEKVGF